MAQNNEKTVILWGYTQVGKTTALASYLCHRPPSWIDRDAEETSTTLKRLSRTWNGLRRNQLARSTFQAKTHQVRHTNGQVVSFRDMRGGDAENLDKEEDAQALREASAVMLFVSWPDLDEMATIVAAENALRYMRPNCPVVLVITKIECSLRYEEASRMIVMKAADFVQERSEASPSLELLNKLPADRIFPISVYGYSPVDNRPAHYRDELGRLVPWNIHPFEVPKPFDNVLVSLL